MGKSPLESASLHHIIIPRLRLFEGGSNAVWRSRVKAFPCLPISPWMGGKIIPCYKTVRFSNDVAVAIEYLAVMMQRNMSRDAARAPTAVIISEMILRKMALDYAQ
ncbi:hypothetical protein ACLOJK_032922 [Asimina triloba]